MIMAPCKDVLDKFPGITIVGRTSDYVITVAKPVFKAFEKIKVKAEITNQKKISYNTVTHLSFITKAVQNNGEETAVYLHGGGTTGKSKTICLSSNNLNALAFKLSFLDSPHRPGEEFSLALGRAAVLSQIPASSASLRLVLESLFGVEFLLTGGENELSTTVFAYQRLVFVHGLEPPE